jgi:predicted component of type VI protein secretion system
VPSRETLHSGRTPTDAHRRYVDELEQYAKVCCSDDDPILNYLRTGRRYAIQASFSTTESNELFTKISQEFSDLNEANRDLKSQLEHLCSLTDTYAAEHERRKSKRSALVERATTADDSLRDLCELIARMFPHAVEPGKSANIEQALRILLSVSQQTGVVVE